jgi:hypothetical protein
MLGGVVTVIAATVGGLVVLVGGYLVTLALAAFRYAPPLREADAPEGAVGGAGAGTQRTAADRRVCRVASRADVPAGGFEIVVVADNCSDATAQAAERAGAGVIVRDGRRCAARGTRFATRSTSCSRVVSRGRW